ncbi:hypothetical protein, partial [uncultured Flavobacterium sp.]|uniref:hypothetical protein n=1 Tax=uncultured Flavobacterium sp. TaxID=165435 RepID=UPI0025FFC77F
MRKNILLFTILYFCAACSSDEENGGNGDGGNNNGNSDFTITLENSDFDGEAVIMYTDNSTATATFENGELGLISSSAGNKTIKSLTIGDYEPILIGRLEGEDISLNYNDGILDFRTAQGGPIPVGTFAEFQLIRKNNTSLGGSYAMESNLDLMEIEWIPIGNSSTGGSFRGTFDGNNFEIKNLKSSSEGLFGTASAESNTTFTEIKNLVIRSGIIQGCTIASIADIVSNCSNYATVTLGSLNQGSLVGIIVKRIENCTNFGNINCNYNSDSVGGIVGGVSNRKGELL